MRKNILSIGIALLSLLQAGIAQTFTKAPFTYEIVQTPQGALQAIVTGSSATGAIVIEPTIEHDAKQYTVTGIAERAFYNNTGITSVELPGTLASIGQEAFSGCTNLASVVFAENTPLASMGLYAFQACSRLTSIDLPNSLKEIPGSAFYNCSSLNRIDLPDSLSSIGAMAFVNCRSLSMISLPCTLRSISENAFTNCTGLTEIFLWTAVPPQVQPSSFSSNGATLYSFIPESQLSGWNARNHATLTISLTENTYTGKAPQAEITGNTSANYSLTPDTKDWNPNAGSHTIAALGIDIAGKDSYTKHVTCILPEGKNTYTIQQKLLTLSVDNFERLYGDPNPSVEDVLAKVTYDGLVNNESDPGFTKYPSSLMTDATLTSNVGSYSLYLSQDGETQNYKLSYIPGTLTIKKAPLTISANSYTIKYGEKLPNFSCSYTGFKNNETYAVLDPRPSVKYEGGDRPVVGTYTLTPEGADARNYEISYADGKLTVNKAPLTITANSYTIVYGDTLPAMEYSCKGFAYDEDESVLTKKPHITYTAGNHPDAGRHPIKVSGAEADNYEITHVDGILHVEKALLTVTARPDTIVYGQDRPALAYDIQGFVLGQDTSAIQRMPGISAAPGTDAGTYPVTVSGGRAANYDFTYENATLTILKKHVTGQIGDLSRLYGAEEPDVDSVLETVSYNGLVEPDSDPGFLVKPNVLTDADAGSPVGRYSIGLSDDNEAANYEVSFLAGNLQVTPAPLSVLAVSDTVTYGEGLPAFQLRFSGFVNNEDESVLSEMPGISCQAGDKPGVGSYPVSVTGGKASNYTLLCQDGLLTVKKAPLHIIPCSDSIVYGETCPELECIYEGFVLGEDASALSRLPLLACQAGERPEAGQYAIDASGAEAGNYEISYGKGVLTVSKAELAATARSYVIQYGENLPDFEITYEGFVNNDSEADIDILPEASCEAGDTPAAGTYPITVAGGEARNYEFSYTDGSLVVEKAGQNISWEQEFPGELPVGTEITLSATASSGLAVSYSSSNGNVISILQEESSFRIVCLAEGEATVTASQEGNSNYLPAETIAKTIRVKTASANESDWMAGIRCYPNPAGDEIHVTGLGSEAELRLFDLQGRLMLDTHAEGRTTTIRIDFLAPGAYILRMSENGMAGTLRVVKR